MLNKKDINCFDFCIIEFLHIQWKGKKIVGGAFQPRFIYKEKRFSLEAIQWILVLDQYAVSRIQVP